MRNVIMGAFYRFSQKLSFAAGLTDSFNPIIMVYANDYRFNRLQKDFLGNILCLHPVAYPQRYDVAIDIVKMALIEFCKGFLILLRPLEKVLSILQLVTSAGLNP